MAKQKKRQKAQVYVRETGQFVSRSLRAAQRKDFDAEMIKKWQNMLDIAAEIIGVPASLIMRAEVAALEVFLRSASGDNPYVQGQKDRLGHGLYCETVIGRQAPLLVPNARKDEVWQDNPDVKLDMISYYGLPLLWPTGETFGTLCILDRRENQYQEPYLRLMDCFAGAIEADLALIAEREKLLDASLRDYLTGVSNRRAITQLLDEYYRRWQADKTEFTVVVMDIDGFKAINDEFGHKTGDSILEQFSRSVTAWIDEDCTFGRWGGDEFILVCPNGGWRVEEFSGAVQRGLETVKFAGPGKITVSLGTAVVAAGDDGPDAVISRADQAMYDQKRSSARR